MVTITALRPRLVVTDADALACRMAEAGATVVHAVDDRPYGRRDGRLADPFGHIRILSQPA